VARVDGGRIVRIAGQVALDKAGNVVGKGNFRAQVQPAFENLKSAVEAAGGSFRDNVKLNSYFLDLSCGPVYREIRDRYIAAKKSIDEHGNPGQRFFGRTS